VFCVGKKLNLHTLYFATATKEIEIVEPFK